jgi:hypothetical protein
MTHTTAEARYSMPHQYAYIHPSVAPAMRRRLRESVCHITPTLSVTSYTDGFFTQVPRRWILGTSPLRSSKKVACGTSRYALKEYWPFLRYHGGSEITIGEQCRPHTSERLGSKMLALSRVSMSTLGGAPTEASSLRASWPRCPTRITRIAGVGGCET